LICDCCMKMIILIFYAFIFFVRYLIKGLIGILILIFIVYSAQGQAPAISPACSKWVETSKSENGLETVIAKDILSISDDGGKSGLSIYAFLNSTRKVLILSIQAVGSGTCVDRGDRILIIFDNGSSLSLANMNDFNCDGSSTLYFGGGLGRKDEFNLLVSHKIASMTVWTRDAYMKKNFSEEQAAIFSETLNCLYASLL
jgi:hypothetical protein